MRELPKRSGVILLYEVVDEAGKDPPRMMTSKELRETGILGSMAGAWVGKTVTRNGYRIRAAGMRDADGKEAGLDEYLRRTRFPDAPPYVVPWLHCLIDPYSCWSYESLCYFLRLQRWAMRRKERAKE